MCLYLTTCLFRTSRF